MSRLLQFAEIVKYGRNFPGFDHLGTALKFRRRKENSIRHRLFTSSIKLEIRHCHVLVVKARQRNVQKSVMHVQRFCFAPQTYYFFDVLATKAVVIAKLPYIFLHDTSWCPNFSAYGHMVSELRGQCLQHVVSYRLGNSNDVPYEKTGRRLTLLLHLY